MTVGSFAMAQTVPGGRPHYAVLQRLAVGGMAEIYLARMHGDAGLERHVVVKRLLPRHAGDDQLVRAFIDEARLVARMNHDNIAQVYDIGRVDGEHFFSMQYLHGVDLSALLERLSPDGRLPLPAACAIGSAIASALDYAHGLQAREGGPLGLVHRDVSPSNVMVTYAGGVKLVDFGIAKTAESAAHTAIGVVKGKAPYMSPEQCMGDPLDHRSDVFSLGAVLYELTTGRNPFTGPDERPDEHAIMQRILAGTIAPPSTIVADYPPALEQVVMTALAPAREARYPSAGALREAIEAVASARGWRLSTAQLAELMAELYGAPPEPWRQPARDIAGPDDVTAIEAVDDTTLVAARLTRALNAAPAPAAHELPTTVVAVPSWRELPTALVGYDAPTRLAPAQPIDTPRPPHPAAPPPRSIAAIRIALAAVIGALVMAALVWSLLA